MLVARKIKNCSKTILSLLTMRFTLSHTQTLFENFSMYFIPKEYTFQDSPFIMSCPNYSKLSCRITDVYLLDTQL